MKEPSLLEKIIYTVILLKQRLKGLFCKHHVVTNFTADIFIKDGWERCSGVGECKKCELDFMVSVPRDKKEHGELTNYKREDE